MDKRLENEFSVQIQLGVFKKLQFQCMWNGKPISTMSSQILESFRPYARRITDYHDSESVFVSYFESDSELFPIVFVYRGQRYFLNWNSDFLVQLFTQLNIKEQGVDIQRVGFDGDSYNHRWVLIGDQLVADLENGILGLVEDVKNTLFWNSLVKYKELEEEKKKTKKSSGSSTVIDSLAAMMHMNFDGFNNFMLERNFLQKDLKDIRLQVLGENVEAKEDIMTYRLVVDIDEISSSANLSVQGGASNMILLVRSEFFHCFLTQKFWSVSLRTDRYRQLLLDTLTHLIHSEPRQYKKIIDESVKLFDIEHQVIVKKELNEFCKLLLGSQASLSVQDNQWTLLLRQFKIESELFLALSKYFLSLPDVSFSDFSVSMSLGSFLSVFNELKEELSNFNIPIEYQSQVLEKSELSFDVSVKSEDNWFDIQPNVYFGDELLSEEQYQSILDKKGIFEVNGKSVVLDRHSYQLLMSLTSVSRQQKVSDPESSVEIYRVPRLQILDWIVLAKKGVNINMDPKDRAWFDRLCQFDKIPSKALPRSFKGELRDYQQKGFEWLCFLYEYRFGACLADDMGLGKTVQALVFLSKIAEDAAENKVASVFPHLVVVPPSLVFNWEQEIARFCPGLKSRVISSQFPDLIFEDVDIIITTYEFVRRQVDIFSQQQFQVVIFDEVQLVKNVVAARTAAARQLKGVFKICLTGTPLENHIGEYYSIVDLVVPGLLGSYTQFQSQVKMGLGDVLIRRTRPFVMRRSKDNILDELPEKQETLTYLNLSAKQRSLYLNVIKQVKEEVQEAYKTKTDQVARMLSLTAILRLRQICLSASLLDDSIDEVSPKVTRLGSALQDLFEEGHSSLVFSQFTSFLDKVEPYLKKLGLTVFRLDGSVPISKRQKIVTDFQNHSGPAVFLISLKSGGFGLNLVKASYVFHMDPWWNPAVEDQASDRVHRIGQTQKVTIIRMVMHHTIEEKMMELKKKKSDLFESVMKEGSLEQQKGTLKKEDIEYLLSGDLGD
tara:strand:+ start:1334 stop:4345 length:3012 start_codon:yes stop_codon:yes gene_type:complete